MMLAQVANFYNTIDKQIIECQRGMLLEDALAFEKVTVTFHRTFHQTFHRTFHRMFHRTFRRAFHQRFHRTR